MLAGHAKPSGPPPATIPLPGSDHRPHGTGARRGSKPPSPPRPTLTRMDQHEPPTRRCAKCGTSPVGDGGVLCPDCSQRLDQQTRDHWTNHPPHPTDQ
ncbi:hypothetical protein GCM10012275_63030 [Longimycelium tulufanense]|uniref:Uncharacterized protein n=2 Tax=Longimycelium tulufanense TaxID=907463 RepID=A0A8J3CKS8_9PSEU|nr:hypothetical protein GCM10012275_63030 [Longimycelium tulufanense]